MRTGEAGFTYLLLLFALALTAAGLAALGEGWTRSAQREREAELVFRGQAFATALLSYQAATRAGSATPATTSTPAMPAISSTQPALPLELHELLVDERRAAPAYHLRRLYADPFTGRADWRVLRDADGRICAVASRSAATAMRRQGVPLAAGVDPTRARVSDWHFGVACRTRPAPTMPPAAQGRST